MFPKQAQEILKKHGTIVTEKEAKIIVDFLFELADISVKTYMKTHDTTIQKFDSFRGTTKRTESSGRIKS
jgi:hypothetical protein